MEHISWDDLRVLLAIHRAGSLLGAGNSLGLSTSTTGRRIDALEQAAGAQLVFRSRGGTVLAPAALRLVRLAEALEHGLDAEQRDRRAGQGGGTVKVSVPDGMTDVVAKALIELQLAQPHISFEVIGENRMADVAARESDIAVRLTRSRSSVLVEKQLVTLRFGLYASAEYLRRHLPTKVLRKGDAASLSFLGLDPRWSQLPHEQWMVSLGAVHFPFRCSAFSAVIEAARQGLGIAAIVEHDARSAGLVRIETSSPGPVQALYLVFHPDLRKAAHVRAAASAIENCLRSLHHP